LLEVTVSLNVERYSQNLVPHAEEALSRKRLKSTFVGMYKRYLSPAVPSSIDHNTVLSWEELADFATQAKTYERTLFNLLTCLLDVAVIMF
jgi:hypothetical protein